MLDRRCAAIFLHLIMVLLRFGVEAAGGVGAGSPTGCVAMKSSSWMGVLRETVGATLRVQRRVWVRAGRGPTCGSSRLVQARAPTLRPKREASQA